MRLGMQVLIEDYVRGLNQAAPIFSFRRFSHPAG